MSHVDRQHFAGNTRGSAIAEKAPRIRDGVSGSDPDSDSDSDLDLDLDPVLDLDFHQDLNPDPGLDRDPDSDPDQGTHWSQNFRLKVKD